MGAGIQTKNGKAFEYACIIALYEQLKSKQQVIIEESAQADTARNLYRNVSENMRHSLDEAANAAVRVIERLEPQLWNACGNEPLYLSLQPDSAGIKGDVRDILCFRKQNNWEIGLSCKHNHHAVKHSRLSDTIDFGKEWLSIPCSKDYFDKVVPLFSELREIRDNSKKEGKPALWSDMEHKTNTIEVICDEGWQISMRLHNASSKVEPSLKFDVNLISLPTSAHVQVEPWDNTFEEARSKRLTAYAKGGILKDMHNF